MIIILKSKVSLHSFKSAFCLAVENIFLKQRNASFLDRLKNGIYVEKRRENTSQIASSACLRSSRSIGHHYVNVYRRNKVAKSGKKKSVICKKKRRYQLKNFKSINPIRRQRILQPSFHIQWWWDGWVGGGGGESRKMCVPLEKSWLRP